MADNMIETLKLALTVLDRTKLPGQGSVADKDGDALFIGINGARIQIMTGEDGVLVLLAPDQIPEVIRLLVGAYLKVSA